VSNHRGLPNPFKVFLLCGSAWSALLLVYFISMTFHGSEYRAADVALILIFILASFGGALYIRLTQK
jgi:hypothetical protein